MPYAIDQGDPALTEVRLSGRIDAGEVAAMQPSLLREVSAAGKPALVDLSGVSFMASLGIRMLVELAKELKQQGVRLALLGPVPLVERSLRASGFASVIGIHADVELAKNDLLHTH